MFVARYVGWAVYTAACYATFAAVLTATAAEPSTAKIDAESADAADPFAVPDGTPAEKLTHIEEIANPTTRFESRDEELQYRRDAADAIIAAADSILAGEATDQQLVDAVEWKLAALQAQVELGAADVQKRTSDWLAELAADPRPAVAKAAARATFVQQLLNWQQLSADERASAFSGFVDAVKKSGVDWQDGMVLSNVAMLVDMDSGRLAVDALNELIPSFRDSSDARVRQQIPHLEGIARRLNLLGNKLELEGTLLDGTTLDWDSYRGKVVLVDFWATWCGPCRAEVPNILKNYAAFHDKGFEVLGVSLDNRREQALTYIQQTEIPWPTLFSDDPQSTGWQHPMAVQYAITAIPQAILVDQEGNVVHMDAREDTLGEQLQKLLGEPAPVQASGVTDDDEKTAQTTAPNVE